MKNILLFFLLFTLMSFSQKNENDLGVNQSISQPDTQIIKSLPADLNTKNVLNEQLETLEIFEIPNISVPYFIINLFLAALLSFLLAYVYVRFGNSISNRKQFSRIFVILSLTTMLIITVVKSSLALSLGLVGALSIIRFRTAIKEPEELVYLFLAISIGLGFGANQGIITSIALTIVLSVITLTKLFSSKYYDNQNLYLTILCLNPKLLSSKKIIDTISNYSKNVQLRRIDENSDLIEISVSIELDNFDHVNDLKEELQKSDTNIKFTLLDNKGIIG